MAKITATLDDGSARECSTSTFMCLADRVAFERYFGQSSAALAAVRELFDDDGKPKPGADLSILREEWIAFFAHRALLRADREGTPAYDDFIESVAGVTIDQDGDVPAPNPTEPAPPAS